MRTPRYRLRLVALTLLLSTSCDCEDRIRKALSNEGERTMKAPDAGAPSGPAESEPNNTPAEATDIVIGKELRPVYGELASADDVDWFSVRMKGDPASLEVIVEPEIGADLSVHVEVDGGAPLSYDLGRRGDPETIPVLKVTSAAQRFVVRPEAESAGGYTIRFKRHMASDELEAEPNDDAKVATRLAVPGEIQGRFDRPDDRDAYRLVGEPNKPYLFELVPPRGGRLIARIFEDEKFSKPALTLQVAGEKPVQIPNIALSADKLRWLVVTPVGQPSGSSTYRIRSVPHPPFEGGLELEPNDGVPTPVEFVASEEHDGRVVDFAGYIHSSEDVDRFELVPPELPEQQPEDPSGDAVDTSPDPLSEYRDKERLEIPVTAKLVWKDKQTAYGIVWTSPSTGKVEFRRTSGDPEVVACGLDLDAGPATMEVRAERIAEPPAVGQPQYHVTVIESSQGNDWEAEPNNDRGTADVLDAPRRGAFSVPDDIDLYVFAVPFGEDPDAAVPVKVAARGASVDLTLRLFDDQGGVIANIDTGPVGAEERTSVDLPGGIYFAEVRWNGGKFCAPYTITASRADGTALIGTPTPTP